MSIATFSKRELANAPDALELQASLVSNREIAGHVYDPAAPDTRFVVDFHCLIVFVFIVVRSSCDK